MSENESVMLEGMYKTDIHLHLDGSLRPATMIEMAKKDCLDIEVVLDDGGVKDIRDCAPGELGKAMEVGTGSGDLVDYLGKFDVTLALMQSAENLGRIAHELVEDLKKDNVIYAEVRFAPHLHTNGGMSVNEVVACVCKSIEDAQREFGVAVGVILCMVRHLDIFYGYEVVDLAYRFKNRGVVGIDVAGDELNFPISLYEDVLEDAKDKGLNITVHAGEADGAISVREAISMGATRIGHGIRAVEDERVLELAASMGVVFEISFNSNLQTGVLNDMSEYPLKKFLSKGIKCALCTDNRLISGTSLTKEIRSLDRVLKSTVSVVDYMAMFEAGIEGAFINEKRKTVLLEKMRARNEHLFRNGG